MTITQVFNITMEAWGVLFCLLAAITALIPGYRNEAERWLIALEFDDVVLLIADILAWVFRGSETTLGFYMVRISNFMVFLLNYLMFILFARYLVCFIDQKTKAAKLLTHGSCALAGAGIIILISNLFTGWLYYFDEANYYYRGPGAAVSWGIGFACLIFAFVVLLLRYNDMTPARFVSFMCYIFLPFVAILIQANFYGISLNNITYTITILIVYFVNVAERGHEMAEQQKRLNEMHTKIMLSQIQPHFLYNSLTAIYYLCDIDPKRAKEAISQFSDYLRANMDSLKEIHAVPFQKEMDHVKNYLNLEILRFDEELRIEYDIKESDFRLPALTVQPIVENAVKYGVGKKMGGGTVKISTSREKGFFRIDIEDDGAGFDVTETKDDGRTHIGIDNVRKRLEDMVGGSLEVTSTLGVGTHAIIRVPDTYGI